MQPAPQDIQLMSKHRVLSLKPQLRLEWRDQDGQNEKEQPYHSATLGDSIAPSRWIGFSVHIGEAAHYQSQGESLALDERLWGEAGIEQEARRVTDPWEEILRNMPELTTYCYWRDGARHEGTRTIIYDDGIEEKVIASHVLQYVLGIEPGNQTTQQGMRLSTVMKKVGWERPKNGYVSILGIGREKGYYRKREP
jgi:hypothetical protein